MSVRDGPSNTNVGAENPPREYEGCSTSAKRSSERRCPTCIGMRRLSSCRTHQSTSENSSPRRRDSTSSSLQDNPEAGTALGNISTVWHSPVQEESQRRLSTHIQNQRNIKRRLKCDRPGCKVSFVRPYELNRHKTTVHASHPIQCPHSKCLVEMRRLDKLTAHIRSIHGADSLYNCIVPGCLALERRCESMHVHLFGHLQSSDLVNRPFVKAVFNALSPAYRRCPLQSCRTVQHVTGFTQHLLKHAQNELQEVAHTLETMCYSLTSSCTSPEHLVGDLHHILGDNSTRTIYIRCPVSGTCLFLARDHGCLDTHIRENHLLRDAFHFKIWVAHVEEKLAESGYALLGNKSVLKRACIWKAWRLDLLSLDTVELPLNCPFCHEFEYVSHGRPVTHHLSLLTDNVSLVPYRWSIMSLFPDFISHPAFNDELPHSIDRIQEFRLRKMSVSNDSNAKGWANTTGTQSSNLEISTGPYDFHLTDLSTPFSANQFEDSVIGLSGDNVSCTINDIDAQEYIFDDIDWDIALGYPEIPSVQTFRHAEVPDDTSCSCGSDKRSRSDDPSVSQEPQQRSQSSSSIYGTIIGRPHICKYPGCAKAFIRHSELALHQRSHKTTEEKPWICKDCGNQFLFRKDLARHERTHQSPGHICPVRGCNRLFRRSDHLDRHVKKLHVPRLITLSSNS